MAAAGPAGGVQGGFADWCDNDPLVPQIQRYSSLDRDVVGIVAGYVGSRKVGAFARSFWQQRGIVTGEVRPIDHKFYEYWRSPDPVDSSREVSETHYCPVWIPERLSLGALERAGLQFELSEELRRCRDTPAEGGYYVVMRKGVLGRDLSELQQIQLLNEAGYPDLPNRVEIAAALFAINQHNGSGWFDATPGMGTRPIYTRCAERLPEEEGGAPWLIGSYDPSSLDVIPNRSRSNYEGCGVAALRKF